MTEAISNFERVLRGALDRYSDELTRRVLNSVLLTKLMAERGQIAVEGGATIRVWDTSSYLADCGLSAELKFDWKELIVPWSCDGGAVHESSGELDHLRLAKLCIDEAEASLRTRVERASIHELINVLTPLTPLGGPGRPDSGELHEYGGVTIDGARSDTEWIQPRVYTPAQLSASESGLTVSAIERAVEFMNSTDANDPDVVISSKKQWRHLSNNMRARQMWHGSELGDIGFRHFIVEGMPVFYLPDDHVSGRPSPDRPWHEDHVAVLSTRHWKLVRHSTDWLQVLNFRSVSHDSRREASLRSVMAFLCTRRSRQAIIKY